MPIADAHAAAQHRFTTIYRSHRLIRMSITSRVSRNQAFVA
jgi:hypothetical protein